MSTTNQRTPKDSTHGTVKMQKADAVDLRSQKDTVTQLTSATTGVTLNSNAGAITTFTLSAAANGAHTFVVTNNNATPNSIILVNMLASGGAGIPVASVSARTSGTFSITIDNAHSTAAFTSIGIVGFLIV